MVSKLEPKTCIMQGFGLKMREKQVHDTFQSVTNSFLRIIGRLSQRRENNARTFQFRLWPFQKAMCSDLSQLKQVDTTTVATVLSRFPAQPGGHRAKSSFGVYHVLGENDG